jgi:hypothetical protein
MHLDAIRFRTKVYVLCALSTIQENFLQNWLDMMQKEPVGEKASFTTNAPTLVTGIWIL